MSKKIIPRIKEDVTCNLIPMVDIMFLLLLFFLLGADMSQREQAELVLPTASEIKENEKVKTDEPTTTVNVQHVQGGDIGKCPINASGTGYCREPDHWAFVIRGREVPQAMLKDQLKAEADETLETDPDPEAKVRLSARKIIIRGDRAAPYGMVNKIIETCGLVGIYKVEVGAAVPAPTN
jgi:biopolymer transport protein ExbD